MRSTQHRGDYLPVRVDVMVIVETKAVLAGARIELPIAPDFLAADDLAFDLTKNCAAPECSAGEDARAVANRLDRERVTVGNFSGCG